MRHDRGGYEERRGLRGADLLGLLLFFGGAALLVWLAWRQNAPVADAVRDGLLWLLGVGSYAIPPALMFCGVLILLGRERLILSRAALGCALLVLTLVTWSHLAVPAPPAAPPPAIVVRPVPPPGAPPGTGTLPRFRHVIAAAAAQNAPDPTWSDEHLRHAGGYVGAALATGLVGMAGTTAAHLFLAMLTCIGILLLANRPFAEVAAAFRRPATGLWALLRGGVTGLFVREPEIDDEAPLPYPYGAGEETPAVQRRGLFGWLRLRQGRASDGAQPALESEDRALPAEAPLPAVAGPMADGAEEAGVAVPAVRMPAAEERPYTPPSLALLHEPPPAPPRRVQEEMDDKMHVVERTLQQFGIKANVVEIAHGPTVTRYEIQLAPGIKVSKIVSLADNLAMSLEAIDVRVEAPIPGKAAIGLEVPNSTPTLVTLRECLDLPEFLKADGKLTFALGKDVAGAVKLADLARMPHLLIGGATNSGKSVCLNTLIASIVYRATPDEVQLILIDPKRVELSLWDGIPHLLMPVVKNVDRAAATFRAALREMERRYTLFSNAGTRNIDGYNQRAQPEERLPFVVIVVDELADLMMQCAAEVETSICRLAQLARATGIHLVIATQRPSVDVITGTIKANISSRIAFAVSSQVDSRTILDMSGAERLIGRGDMLFLPIDASKPLRVQGCFLSEQETNALVEYLSTQPGPTVRADLPSGDGDEVGGGEEGSASDDPLFEDAVRLVVAGRHASTSMIQRKFRIGYTRAARLLDAMEERGIVGPLEGARPREILVRREQLDDMFLTGYGE